MSINLSALQKQRRDTAANWTAENPTLLAGEIGLESDTGYWKVGDGATAWTSLAYVTGLGAEIPVSRLADGSARQLLQTAANGTDVEWTSNVDVPGTLDVTGAATFDAAVTIQGDLTVNGTTTTIDTQNLIVEDKNVIIGNVTTPTDVTADGGGITLKGTTDKTINWVDATDAWTLSEHVNIASGKEYRIGGTKVLDATSLGSSVLITSANITDGTIVNGDVNASAAIAGTKISPDFGSQNVTTTGTSTAASFIPTSSTAPTNGVYLPAANSVAISTGGSGRLFVDSSGKVGVGTSTPSSTSGGVDISSGGIGLVVGADGSASTRTNAADKIFRIGSAHYTNAEEPVCIAFGQNLSSDNELNFGGGSAALNAATYMRFFTAANNTTTGGTERMRLDSSGRLGIGTTSASSLLHLSVPSDGVDGTKGVRITNPAGTAVMLECGVYGDSFIGTTSNSAFSIRTNNTERCRLDTSGRILVGTSTSTSGGGGEAFVQVAGTSSGGNIHLGLFQFSNSADGGELNLGSSRGTTVGSFTAVQDGDPLGRIRFVGSNGSNISTSGAFITAKADGQTWASGDCPTRLEFSVTRDGSASPTSAMRITNSGRTVVLGYTNAFDAYSEQGAGTSYELFIGGHSATTTAPGSGTNSFRVFTNGNVQNTNNSYGSISDAKLKENIVDAGSQWNDLKFLQVRKYNFKEETGQQTHTQIGLVAQEVELVSPGLVTESPDRDAEGNDLGTVTKSVNYSVLYMKAVKALQEAMERIETLEAKVAALEA